MTIAKVVDVFQRIEARIDAVVDACFMQHPDELALLLKTFEDSRELVRPRCSMLHAACSMRDLCYVDWCLAVVVVLCVRRRVV